MIARCSHCPVLGSPLRTRAQSAFARRKVFRTNPLARRSDGERALACLLADDDQAPTARYGMASARSQELVASWSGWEVKARCDHIVLRTWRAIAPGIWTSEPTLTTPGTVIGSFFATHSRAIVASDALRSLSC